MTSRKRTRRTGALLHAAVVGALTLTAAGCGGEDDEQPADTSVAAQRLCGGQAVSTEAAQVLELVMGTKRFEKSGEDSTVSAAAKAMGRNTSTTEGDGTLCDIHPAGSADLDELTVEWSMDGTAPESGSVPQVSTVPRDATRNEPPRRAHLTFACFGGREFPGSAPRYVTLSVGPRPLQIPDADAQDVRKAYATVAHSFSLALAKELGCKDDGGLATKPALPTAGKG
ncbi:hypothetical protein C6N75_19485 [Streptomyces solincola]|uniref:Lipoprotein n=1 Tax=Streptomyces solincola TaxID=2100817 RepID=A0A2S9PT39_9ACTN|nr:hypothetical protein [Streptomyces solincola]PRH77589.1 hypothetical protein C6N75_19485 [Streptomyces solincola]